MLDRLREDQGLLQAELWQLFETEGAGKLLTSQDGWFLKPYQPPRGGPTIPARPERTWHHALVTLVADRTIDRQRLLDATLAAFLRDWTKGDVGWFVKLHDGLAPSLDEVADRQAAYGRLLSVHPGTPVNLGLRAIGSLLTARRLNFDILLKNVSAVLVRPDKGPVIGALRLLAEVAKTDPERTDQVAEVTQHALSHEELDVREAAIALITKLVPDETRRQGILASHGDAMAPGVQPEGVSTKVARPRPRTASPAPLEPVADADELVELLARLVEEADDPAEVERLLDGTLRFARHRPSRGLDAMVNRLEDLASTYYPGAWSHDELRGDLVQLGLVWLDGRAPGRGYSGRQYAIDFGQGGGATLGIPLKRPDWSLAGLVTMRIHEVAVAVSCGGGALLSFPTGRDGTLDVDVLNVRFKSVGRTTTPLPLDAGLSLLRLPPEHYPQLRLPAGHRTARLLEDQLATLQAYGPSWELVTGLIEGLYRTSVVRNAVSWRDVRSSAGNVDNIVSAVLDRTDPLLNLALEADDGEYASRFEQVTAMWPLMLPHHPDLLAAHAHPRLNRALTKNRSGTEPVLYALGRAKRPPGPPAMSALILGLAAKNGVERARAVDAMVDLSERAVLNGAVLGTILSDLLVTGAIVGSRIVPGLADAARSGGQAAGQIVDCLSAALAALAGNRDAHRFIDLLAQLATQEGRAIALPPPLADLARSKETSVLAKACRRVP